MNSPVRTFLSLLVFGFIGTGTYFGTVKALDIYKDMEKSSLKKQISVKPENIKEKQALMDPWSIDKEELTFFDTLDDPSMSKFIDLNEKVVQPQKTTNKTSDFDSKVKKKSILQSDNVNGKNILKPVAPKIETRKQGESLASGFVLQVGSFQTLETANSLKNNLGKKGYPAFVIAARLSEEGEVWHRVVIGRFKKKEAAVKFATRVAEKENLKSVIKWQEGLKHNVSP